MEILLGIIVIAALIGGPIWFVRAREAGKLSWFDRDRGGSAR